MEICLFRRKVVWSNECLSFQSVQTRVYCRIFKQLPNRSFLPLELQDSPKTSFEWYIYTENQHEQGHTKHSQWPLHNYRLSSPLFCYVWADFWIWSDITKSVNVESHWSGIILSKWTYNSHLKLNKIYSINILFTAESGTITFSNMGAIAMGLLLCYYQ